MPTPETGTLLLLQSQEILGIADRREEIETRRAVILNAKIRKADHRPRLIQKRATI